MHSALGDEFLVLKVVLHVILQARAAFEELNSHA